MWMLILQSVQVYYITWKPEPRYYDWIVMGYSIKIIRYVQISDAEMQQEN